MRRISIALVLAAVAASTAAFAYGGSHPDAFRLDDAAAACRLDGSRLVCAGLGVRSGVALRGRGAPAAAPGRVWWDASTPVLHHWSDDGISCSEQRGAIECRNADGATIVVGGDRIEVGS
jgi:hypothetical protein